MKNKCLLSLLVLICIGLFVSTNTFALEIYNNINIDYRFIVDGEDSGDLQFKLYDRTGTINLESKYNSEEKYYYFEEASTDSLKPFIDNYFSELNEIDFTEKFEQIMISNPSNYCNKVEERRDVIEEFRMLANKNRFQIGDYSQGYHNDCCSTYRTIPLIMENVNTNDKKIIFGTFHISVVYGDYLIKFSEYDYNFSLTNINNDFHYNSRERYIGDEGYFLFDTAIEFMRKAVFDYSDELWEELHNEPIASTEMSLEGSSVVVGDDGDSVDLNRPSVIKFGKDTNEEDNSVIENIINPYTWNNGMIMLIISLIVVISMTIVFFRKRSRSL